MFSTSILNVLEQHTPKYFVNMSIKWSMYFVCFIHRHLGRINSYSKYMFVLRFPFTIYIKKIMRLPFTCMFWIKSFNDFSPYFGNVINSILHHLNLYITNKYHFDEINRFEVFVANYYFANILHCYAHTYSIFGLFALYQSQCNRIESVLDEKHANINKSIEQKLNGISWGMGCYSHTK